MRRPVRERRGQGQDAAAVAGRLLVGDRVVELPEHQAEVAADGDAPGDVPTQAGVGSEGELRAETVAARVARRRAADGHAEGSAHVWGEAAPRRAPGEDELQPGVDQNDVAREQSGRACRGRRILRRIDGEAVGAPVGEAQRHPDGAERYLVADAAGGSVGESDAHAAPAAAQIAEGEDADTAAPDVAVGGVGGLVADLGGGHVVGRYDAKPYEGRGGGAERTYNVAS